MKYLLGSLLIIISFAFNTDQKMKDNFPEFLSVDVEVVYASLSCKLPNGDDGCKCEVVQDLDDCSMPTDCEASENFVTYINLLHQLFTPSEIDARATNETHISETQLRDALKTDGFPLK